MVLKEHSFISFLVAALEKEGLTEKDVQFVSMGIPKALSTILAGQADAALVASNCTN